MDRLIGALLAICLTASAGWAQTWQGRSHDNGHFISGFVSVGAGMDMVCIAPSQGGLSAVEAEAHETASTGPNVWRIELGVDRVPYRNAPVRTDILIWVDGTGYQLPRVIWSEMDGVWSVDLPARDPLFEALARASEVILQPGTDPAWTMPVTGLGAALSAARQTCDAAWAAPTQIEGGTVMARAKAYVRQGCEGGYSVRQDAFRSGFIDGDSIADVVVWWADISCQQGLARPFCGASNCSVDVFLSGGAGPEHLLAQRADLVDLNTGRLGLMLAGRYGICGQNSLGCRTLWFWTAQGWQQQLMPEQ